MASPARGSRTPPVPSMSAWADGSASTANTASGVASIVVDAVTRSVSIPVRRLAGPELIAARDCSASAAGAHIALMEDRVHALRGVRNVELAGGLENSV